jgi:signal transduction histidine kinase
MGIGLGIFKRIIDAHGGRIEVETSLGFGSVFSVFLPLENG